MNAREQVINYTFFSACCVHPSQSLLFLAWLKDASAAPSSMLRQVKIWRSSHQTMAGKDMPCYCTRMYIRVEV